MFRTFLTPVIATAAIVSLGSFAQGQVSFRSLDFSLGKVPQGLVSADFNNDNLPDFAVATTVPAAIHLLLSDARDGFVAMRPLELSGYSIGKLEAGDFNNDGLMDLILGMPKNLQAMILLNAGRGEFIRGPEFRTGPDPHGMALGDIDNDGKLDVVVANSGADFVTIAYGAGRGFRTEQLRAGAGPRHVALANISGDRELELVVTNYNGHSVMVFTLNRGQFQLDQTLELGKVFPDALILRDLNKDGYFDISVAASGDSLFTNSVYVWTNFRNGFDRPRIYATRTFSAVGLASSDFNFDGMDDLVVADREGDQLSIMFGKRDGTFKSELRLDTGPGPDEVLAIDVDGDGDFDLATMNSDGDGITILYNLMRF